MIKKLAFALLALWLLAACSPIQKTEQAFINERIPLSQGTTLGQTFVARYHGLNSFSVYLEPLEAGDGRIVLTVHASPESDQVLSKVTIPIPDITSAGYVPFSFASIPQSTAAYYYVKLRVQGSGAVQVGVSGSDTYLNGALYRNAAPEQAQMAFRLGYEPAWLVRGLAGEGLAWLAFLAVGALLYLLPGWALLAWLWPGWDELVWSVKLGLGSGVSLAIYPLLLLWTDLVGLHLGPVYARLPALAGLAALGWRSRKMVQNIRPRLLPVRLPDGLAKRWPDLALLALIALVFLVRFWGVRGLDAPMWGDSYQHSLITQLLIDHHGLFDSWEPYAELQSLTYHFGFHSLAAVFAWIKRLPAHLAVLWSGQILNGLAVISLLPLAWKLRPSRWTAAVVVLVAGLLSPMPMYYVNWGRYTQLAGQVILPAACYLIWEHLETKSAPRRASVILWITLAGLALTHYRVLIFALFFLLAVLLLNLRPGSLRALGWKILGIGLGSLILFLPWLSHIFIGKFDSLFVSYLRTSPAQATEFTWQYNSLTNLSPFLPPFLWLLLALAGGWSLWRRQRAVAVVISWWFFLLLATNPQWLNLPGMGLISNFAIAIAAYIPAALILGEAAGDLIERLLTMQRSPSGPSRFHSIALAGAVPFLVLLVIGIGLWGARQRLWDIRPFEHALVTRPDMRAAGWIRANLPPDARLLVNSFFAYGGNAIVGSDGGWWLPLLANRGTNLPPLEYTLEKPPNADYIKWINGLTGEIKAKGILHPDVTAALEERGITHIYLGQQQGRVNNPEALLDAGQLLSSPLFKVIYHQDRVWIFQVQSP